MRADLAALTPEGLALLSNTGLVKRAQKEIAAGLGPLVSEEMDGTVLGRFPDGVETSLPPGRGIKDGPCSCGAAGVCRHRLATALVYIASRGQERVADFPTPPETLAQAAERSPDSEVGLSSYLGRRTFERALRLRGKVRAKVESESLVHLDTCSVRFLSGRRLDFARCDCAASGPCEHLALALWALEGTLDERRAEVRTGALEPALRLVEELIARGASQLGQGLGSRFQQARRELLEAGMVWPHSLLEEMEAELDYYHARGGRYRASRLAHCAVSVWARARVARHRPELASPVLGLNQAPETALRKVRLTGLGCRVDKNETLYFFADAAGDRVLVLPFRSGTRGPAGLRRGELAAGQLVSAAAYRSANGMLRLGRGPQSLTSCRDWDHLRALQGPPSRENRLLGECHAAPDVRLMAITRVGSGYYAPGQQELTLPVTADEGVELRLTLSYRACAPLALECLWESRQELQVAAGPMRRDSLGWVMEPTALLAGGTVRVPDLATSGAMGDVPSAEVRQPEDPLRGALQEATNCWVEAVHRGLGRGEDQIERAAQALRRVGLETTAGLLKAARQPEDWLILAARLEMARETL